GDVPTPVCGRTVRGSAYLAYPARMQITQSFCLSPRQVAVYSRPMRSVRALSLAVLVACGSNHRHNDIDAYVEPADAGFGPQCRLVDCAKQGLPPTSISGTVFAPNGTLALYGAIVYVPNIDPGPLPEGVQCDRCDAPLPGDPIVHVLSDTAGHFSLEGVPY